MVAILCLRVNWRAHVASDFKCLIESEGLLKVTGSHIHGKSGNILETMQQRRCYYRSLIGSDIWPSNSGNSADLV